MVFVKRKKCVDKKAIVIITNIATNHFFTFVMSLRSWFPCMALAKLSVPEITRKKVMLRSYELAHICLLYIHSYFF